MSPLVTSTTFNANVFRQDTEPTGVTEGDIWVDTSQDPPVIKVYDGSSFSQSGITITREIDALSASFATASTTKTAVTGLSVTLGSSGDAIIAYNGGLENTNSGINDFVDIFDGTNPIAGTSSSTASANQQQDASLYHSMVMDSETITVRAKTNAGTLTIRYSATANVFQSAKLVVTKFT